MTHKIFTSPLLAKQGLPSGKKVVFTNGCFDILHVGHVTYLAAAKLLGDILVVAVNTDESVRRLKGESRPLNTTDDRMTMLAALESVDVVFAFGEDTPLDSIRTINPDILVKGGDYTIDTIVGSDYVLQQGGKVLTIPLVPNKSTTLILDKLNKL